ncbi:hypothetical protein HPGCJGGD_2563 [Methylobacterium haplocladii]|nr:hypothetical protein HPGCJGGD_2563 [Methylobacterium haplocladii]
MTTASIAEALSALTETPRAAFRFVTSAMVAEVARRARFRLTTAPTLVTEAPTVVTAFLISALIVALDCAVTETAPVALIGWPVIEAVAAKVLAPWSTVPRSVPRIASERSNRTFWLDVPILLNAAVTPTAVSLDSTVLSTVAVIAAVLLAPTATLPTVLPLSTSPSLLPAIVALLVPVTTFAAMTAPIARALLSPGLVPALSFDSTLLVIVAVIVPVWAACTLTSPARTTPVFTRLAVAVLCTSLLTRMPATATAYGLEEVPPLAGCAPSAGGVEEALASLLSPRLRTPGGRNLMNSRRLFSRQEFASVKIPVAVRSTDLVSPK